MTTYPHPRPAPRHRPAPLSMRAVLAAAPLLLCPLAPGGVAAQAADQESAPAQHAVAAAGDVLRAGDVIRLRIWQEPDLSGEFAVDESGFVVLPRLGPVRADRSPEAVRRDVREGYGSFLNHSSIDIVLLRRVQVLGAVRSPGLYHVDPTMNISDVLALAGGATGQGRLEGLELVRNGQRIAANLSPLTTVGSSPLRSGDQIFVPEKSWISRNPGIVVGAVSAALSFTLALLR